MKNLKTSVFWVALFCLAATVRADQFGSTTYYSAPSTLMRSTWENVSLNGRVGCRNDNCDYDITQGMGCKAKSFWSRIEIYGWLEAGVYVNSNGSTSNHYQALDRRGRVEKYQAPAGGNSSMLGNVQSTEPMVNQLWLGVRRNLDTRRGFDWGFRADFLYGTDGWLAQSYGDASFDYRSHHRDYYGALPQLYASLGYRNLSVKIGKFESLLGYEHLQAPESFFYSHSNLFYMEPQTHSGVLFEYRFRPNLWFSFGYVQGADTSFENRFDDHGFLGGIYWRPVSSVTVWYTLYVADLGKGFYGNGRYRPGGTEYRHTFVTNWKITDRWDYSFQWDLGDRDGDDASCFGTAHYLTYKINSRLKAGLRFDQAHGNTYMNASGFSRPFTGNYVGDLYGLTLGLNWTPCARLNIRPEIRFDHADDCRPFDGGRKSDQFSAGCGMIYRF